jgi:hypothetical protein
MNVRTYIPRYSGGVVGLPDDPAIVVTHSERRDLACERRWMFRHAAHLRPTQERRPLEFGRSLHLGLEELHRWWKANPGEHFPEEGFEVCPWCSGEGQADGVRCEPCGASGFGFATRLVSDALAVDDLNPPPEGEPGAAEVAVSVARALSGYIQRWGGVAPYRILAVEASLAMPVVDRSGAVYRPETIVSRVGDRWSMHVAGTTVDEIRVVRWPWYFVGRLDLVVAPFESDALYVTEHKSSDSPEKYLRTMKVDPQVEGYVALLRDAGRRGLLPKIGVPDWRVGGRISDVVASGRQHDPEVLKKGGLSVAKNRTVPSWRFESAVHREGLNIEDYREHIRYLRGTVDERLYVRDQGLVDPDDGEFRAELREVVARFADLRRRAARRGLERSSFPRVPTCVAGAGCSFASVCRSGRILPGVGVEGVEGLTASSGLSWTEPQARLA